MEPVKPDAKYQFLTWNRSQGAKSDILTFRGQDLSRLHSGQLLVARDGPADKSGESTTRLSVIQLGDVQREHC